MENAVELEQRLILVRDLIQELEQAMQPGRQLRLPFLKRWALVRDPFDQSYWQRRIKRVLLLLEIDLPTRHQAAAPEQTASPPQKDPPKERTESSPKPQSFEEDLMKTMKLNLRDLEAQAKQLPSSQPVVDEDLMKTMKLNLRDLEAQAKQLPSSQPVVDEDLLKTMKLNLQELKAQAERQSSWKPQHVDEELMQTMKLDIQQLKMQAEQHRQSPQEPNDELMQTMKLNLAELAKARDAQQQK